MNKQLQSIFEVPFGKTSTQLQQNCLDTKRLLLWEINASKCIMLSGCIYVALKSRLSKTDSLVSVVRSVVNQHNNTTPVKCCLPTGADELPSFTSHFVFQVNLLAVN